MMIENLTYVDLDEFGDLTVASRQLTAHQQVLDQLVTVLTLFGGGLEEEIGEAGAVDGVLGEMCAHRQIGHGCIDFRLDLPLGLLDTCVLHVTPRLWNVGLGLIAWSVRDRLGRKAKINWELFIQFFVIDFMRFLI